MVFDMDMQKIRIAIVIGKFHRQIAEEMLARVREKAEELDADIAEVVEVPGSYEAPVVVKKLLGRADVDCVAVSGFIEKGETLHGEQMGLVVSTALKKLELQYSKPVGMGIIGPGATEEQALKRLDYGAAAVEAAVKMVEILRKI